MHSAKYRLLFALVLVGGIAKAESPPRRAGIPDYQLVAGWPKLPDKFAFGMVSAVGTDADDNVFVLQRAEPPVLVFDRAGRFLRSWGEGRLKSPHGLRVDPAGHVWITDIRLHQALKFDASGKLLLTLGSKEKPGAGPRQFNKPTDVAVSPAGDVFVADGYGNSRVVKFSPEGKYVNEWGKRGSGPGEFNIPHAVCLDRHGKVYVGDRENKRVQVFDADGRFLAQWRESGTTYGVSVSGDRVFVADGLARWIMVLDLEGKPLGRWSMGERENDSPHWVHVDRHGAVYVAFVGARQVRKYVGK